MKRTVLVAIMVIAIVAGVVAYASALSDNGTVAITARVNPAIQMTIGTPSFDFGALNIGSVVTTTTDITVKSNKDWQFTAGAPAFTPDDGLFDAVLSEEYSSASGDILTRGVKSVDTTYTLDLSTDAAYSLDASPTAYQADYLYDAVQQ